MYEVVITGSSRPSIYPIFWESFNHFVKMKGNPKITVYEDVILNKESNKVREFIEDKVDIYVEIRPNKRLGHVFNVLLDNVESKYFLYLQEDWEFLKYIDIDLLVNVMESDESIKQIWFPKYLEDWFWEDFVGDLVDIRCVKLTEYTGKHGNSWAFLPHLVRTDFIKEIYRSAECFKSPRPEVPLKNYIDEMKYREVISYSLGSGDPYIKHLGEGKLSSQEMLKCK